MDHTFCDISVSRADNESPGIGVNELDFIGVLDLLERDDMMEDLDFEDSLDLSEPLD